MPAAPLKDVRVIDFSRVLAGPLCTQYLGDMGAEVIKIEPVEHGDDMRVWPPLKVTQDGAARVGSPYLAVNRNKRSIAINLKTPEGKDLAHQLIRGADVVIESYGAGAAARLGLDAVTTHGLNPKAIHCSITGFGSVGPMRAGKGYDVILQAFSGMLSITGAPDGGPVRSPYSPIDQGTGMHALSAILAALYARANGAGGAALEVSLFDTATAYLGYMLQNYWERGTEPERHGVGHESLCPYEAFDTADGPLILGVANDSMWRAFCKLAGLESYAEDPRFKTNADRVRNRRDCVALVRVAMGRHARDKWTADLATAGIPSAPLHTLGELSAHPHTRASGMVFDYQHPHFGPMRAVAQPVRYDGERASVRRAPPLLGEHTVEVLGELGLAPDAIAALHAQGIVRSHPA